MSFPTSPTNGQQAIVNGIVYNYNGTKGAWKASIDVIKNKYPKPE
jgi:hypothetical protein